MKKIFQRWLLIIVSIVFAITFLIIFVVLSYTTKASADHDLNVRMKDTSQIVETNSLNLEQVIASYNDKAIANTKYIGSKTSSNVNDYVSEEISLEFMNLYYQVYYHSNPDAVNSDGTYLTFDSEFKDSEGYTAIEKLNRFQLLVKDYIAPCIKKLENYMVGTPAIDLHMIHTSVNSTQSNKKEYIIGSTVAGYFGYNMYSEEQARSFMNNLKSSSTESYVQKILKDTSGAYHQYAGIKLDNDMSLEISLDITSYEKALVVADVATIMSPIRVGNTGFIMCAEYDDVSSMYLIRGITLVDDTYSQYIGKSLNSIGLLINDYTIGDFFDSQINGINCRVLTTNSSNYILIACLPFSEINQSRNLSALILGIGCFFIFLILFIDITHLVQRVVIDGIHKVNNGLDKITKGNLNEVITVNENKEFEELSSGINATVDALKEAIEAEKTRIDKDLAMAKAIQLSALPSVFPPYPERKEFDIYATMHPAKEVGGDFYDFFFIDGERLVFEIADVSGKGIPAALFMMTSKTLIKSLAETRRFTLEEVVNKSNKMLCENNETQMFVTAFVCMFNTRTKELTYVNCGHNPPLLRHNNEYTYLHAKKGFVLAGLDMFNYREEHMTLVPGDVVYLYTDGVSEAQNTKEELFNETRLINSLNSIRNVDSPKDIIEHVTKDVKEFTINAEQSDDITQICFTLFNVQSKNMIEVETKPVRENVDILIDTLNKAIGDYPISAKQNGELKVIIDELFTNVVSYAFKEDKETNVFKFAAGFDIDKKECTLIFKDNGTPFDPINKTDPNTSLSVEERDVGGLGIFLVKKMSTNLEYKYSAGFNVLTILKKID